MSGRHPDRRDFLALGVGALAVATLPRALRREPTLVRRRIPVMGTVAEIAVRHPDEPWAQRSMELAFDELRRVDAGMSRFRDDSDVGRVNLDAGRWVTVSEDTALVLAAALGWQEASEGRFDVTAGPRPASFEVDRAASAPRVRLHDPRAAVDLGGIAKGHAVDLAARVLRERGIFHALVNAGGDLVAMGTDVRGEPWQVGVRDPADPTGIVEVLRVADAAVATSGLYARGAHILDPRTGEPVRTDGRSLTVEAPSCLAADAAATALFAASPDERGRILAAAAPGARIAHTA